MDASLQAFTSHPKSGFAVSFRVLTLFTRKMSWPQHASRLTEVCTMIIRDIALLDHIAESGRWVDREQMSLFMDEYKRSSDKEQFVSDRQKQLVAIRRVRLISFIFIPSL